MTETTQGVESLSDGVYSITTTTRYNAAGQPITTVQKQLISQLCPRWRVNPSISANAA